MRTRTITLPYNFNPKARPYQLEVMSNPAPNKVLVLHRRAGKTSLAINSLILDMMDPKNAGRTYWYIAPTYAMAKEIIWTDPRKLFDYLPKSIIKDKNEKDLSILTTNNTRLSLKGADRPDSLVGRDTYGVIVDETQLQKGEELYNRILRPILAANGGWIWFLGTPRGKGFFSRMAEMAKVKPNWQFFSLSAETSGIIPRDELEDIKMTTSVQKYREEYLAEFVDDGGEVFRNVREVCEWDFVEPRQGMVYNIGVDLAKKNDFTVVTVFNRVTQRVDYIDRFNKLDWDYQVSRIEAIARKYHTNNKPSQVKIDSTGVGDPILTYLTKQGISCLGVVLTNKRKEDLVRELQTRLDYKNIKLPHYQPLITELEIFEETVLPSGNFRFGAPDIEDAHDDCVISLCLALHQATPIKMPDISKRPSALADKWRTQNYGSEKYKNPIYNLYDLDK